MNFEPKIPIFSRYLYNIIDKVYFKRFTLLAFSMLLMVGVSFAEGGDDDDKKGDDKSDKDEIVLAGEDSLANDDDDIDIINQGVSLTQKRLRILSEGKGNFDVKITDAKNEDGSTGTEVSLIVPIITEIN